MPVNHVVMFKFKDEATPKEVQPIVNHMLDLKNRCIHPATARPYILSSKGGRENSIEGIHNGFTHIFVHEFKNPEDRDYYVRTDPEHLLFVQSARPWIDKVQVVDFAVGACFRSCEVLKNNPTLAPLGYISPYSPQQSFIQQDRQNHQYKARTKPSSINTLRINNAPKANKMIHRNIPRTASRRLSNSSRGILTPRRTMSLMPRFSPPSPFFSNRNGPTGEFSSLFRLLDDYTDHVTRRFDDTFSELSRNMPTTFAPKFDIQETEEAYQLDGELPGIEKDAVQIEFVDENTLQIKGRTERNFSSGNPSTDAEDVTMTGAGSESNTNAVGSASTEPPATEGSETTKAVANTSNATTTTNTGNGRYWVTERSVGEFSRTFCFPTPINQEAVKANLKNGVLSITVPKKVVEEPATRRIVIE
ncbi:heat shock protein, putative [Talaromyces stipitatus ATCC 10500]|uniref:Heat shock protein, putative n=1 Tax=Talaromyces stipitatus (strain ATCC 10500 / CBS 375.48 / QM 6759 / NRRL 1006) TaxID=441959 RepID=B8M4F4_TALSN|nr:heat shock protein, putative [Talaromyces stipitatus ATCC 10500]EED19149.1 heat shock protein, putative [Talaromyces stipitatus ATCC 10500]